MIISKGLQRIAITIEQTIRRRNFNSESCENVYTDSL